MVVNLLVVACLTSVSLAGASFLLLMASRNYSRRVLALVSGDLWQHSALASLKQKIQMLVDPFDSKAASLIPFERKTEAVEQGDPELTVAQLLQEIANQCQLALNSPVMLSNLELYTKSLYKIQHQLGLTDDDMADVLAETTTRIKGISLLGKTVDKIELVKIGDRVDEKRMWPLSYGLRVKQPYGLVLKTKSGDVLSKAKVTCI